MALHQDGSPNIIMLEQLRKDIQCLEIKTMRRRPTNANAMKVNLSVLLDNVITTHSAVSCLIISNVAEIIDTNNLSSSTLLFQL